jgi:hypothetical protein
VLHGAAGAPADPDFDFGIDEPSAAERSLVIGGRVMRTTLE